MRRIKPSVNVGRVGESSKQGAAGGGESYDSVFLAVGRAPETRRSQLIYYCPDDPRVS